ncbi:MAG TPA: 2-hydroxychromene-2-carboxylate isomerase [Polyangiales bacterium]|nr:2-hydroxychromene-2-carboxylate isomerase [Polyangiales bacterium]
MPTLEVWFEFASTYSYPALMRIEARAEQAGVALAYKPFLLGPIFAGQGWNDSPFNIYEAKGQYMWRDLARICAAGSLPLRRPGVFPRNGLLAARVAFGGGQQAWVPAFVRGVYSANFAEDREISSPEVLAEILGAVGQDPGAALAHAASPEVKAGLRAQTETAQRQGIFGAPSFYAGGELFWGNDRLEQALAWAAQR